MSITLLSQVTPQLETLNERGRVMPTPRVTRSGAVLEGERVLHDIWFDFPRDGLVEITPDLRFHTLQASLDPLSFLTMGADSRPSDEALRLHDDHLREEDTAHLHSLQELNSSKITADGERLQQIEKDEQVLEAQREKIAEGREEIRKLLLPTPGPIPKATPAFLEALGFLKSANPESFERLKEELKTLKANLIAKVEDPCEGLDRLKLFVEYQVFKTGEHVRVYDEVKWARDNTSNFLNDAKNGQNPQLRELLHERGWVPHPENPDQEDGNARAEKALRDALMAELPQHYMCRCRYSKPAPTLMRKDVPTFAKERMRLQLMVPQWHRYDGRTKHEGQIVPASTVAHDSAIDPESLGLVIDKRHFIPFDSSKYALYMVQMPIMSEGLTVELLGKQVKLGDDPESMGIDMTDEYAGVFKRSLNSQRVVEIADVTESGVTAFQLKGAGVPSYGFCAFDGARTGAEVFDLEVEKCCMDLDFFSAALGFEDVVPSMGSLGLIVSDPSKVFMDQEAGRQGAVASRFDKALGVRISDIAGHPDEKDLQDAPEDTPEQRHEKEQARALLTQSRQFIEERFMFANTPEWRADMLKKTSRNQAIANLFGLVYNDTNVEKMGDVSALGSLSDSGGLFSFADDQVLKNQGSVVREALARGMERVKIVQHKDEYDDAYLRGMHEALKAMIPQMDPTEAEFIEAKQAQLLESPTVGVRFFERMFQAMRVRETDPHAPVNCRGLFSQGGIKATGPLLVSCMKMSDCVGLLEFHGLIQSNHGHWFPRYTAVREVEVALDEATKNVEQWRADRRQVLDFARTVLDDHDKWVEQTKVDAASILLHYELLDDINGTLIPLFARGSAYTELTQCHIKKPALLDKPGRWTAFIEGAHNDAKSMKLANIAIHNQAALQWFDDYLFDSETIHELWTRLLTSRDLLDEEGPKYKSVDEVTAALAEQPIWRAYAVDLLQRTTAALSERQQSTWQRLMRKAGLLEASTGADTLEPTFASVEEAILTIAASPALQMEWDTDAKDMRSRTEQALTIWMFDSWQGLMASRKLISAPAPYPDRPVATRVPDFDGVLAELGEEPLWRKFKQPFDRWTREITPEAKEERPIKERLRSALKATQQAAGLGRPFGLGLNPNEKASLAEVIEAVTRLVDAAEEDQLEAKEAVEAKIQAARRHESENLNTEMTKLAKLVAQWV